MSQSEVQAGIDVMVPLAASTDVEVAGGKAAALAAAIARGHRVPDGVVLPVDAPPTDQITGELARAVERLGGSVAVRSSGVGEDSTELSYAGQYETVLDVAADAVVDAVDRCRASADSAAVHSYAVHAHVPEGGLAVLIQRMVDAEVAGVAFSMDPVTGHDHVVIEATAGVGDALLAGEVTGERWTVDDRPVCAGEAGGVLRERQAREIAELCHRLVEDTGDPVDIEWAIENGDLFLLQVRPITVVPIEPVVDVPEGQTFVRDPRVGTPLNPLSFSTWLPLHGRAFTHTFARFGMPVETIDNRHLFGRVYSRTVPIADRGKDGPGPPELVMRGLFALMPPMRRRMKAAGAWEPDAAIHALLDDWDDRGRDRTAARTRDLRARDLTALTDTDLAAHLDEVLDHVFQAAKDHFDLAVGAMYQSMGRLGLFVEEALGWSLHDIMTLVQGHGTASTAHGDAIRALIADLGPAGLDAALADPATLLAHPAGRAYVDDWGHRIQMDLAHPTEAEQPALIAAHLRRHVGSSRSVTDRTAAADAAAERARASLARRTDRRRFDELLQLARRARPTGDETEGTVLEALTLVRYVALETGRRFEAQGRLPVRDDVFFLEQLELSALLRSDTAPLPDLQRRRSEHRWAMANPCPDHVGPDPAPPLPPSVVPKTYRQTVGAVLWSLGASVPEPPQPSASDGSTLRGLPGSPGMAEGPVRVIRDPSQFDLVQQGDIVVCAITQASWSPIFDVIGGLVTEQGGPLSHPGTLAREYGLPCVLSVPGAMERCAELGYVRLDGAEGTVSPAG